MAPLEWRAPSKDTPALRRLRKLPNFFRYVWILIRQHLGVAQLDIGAQ